MTTRRSFLRSGTATAAAFASGTWPARSADTVGVTNTEIKIGQTIPYSGPLSSRSVLSAAREAAYFRMINEQGGVNGRKLNFISVDDGYSPQRAEQTRRLVEQEQVALLFNSLGTPTNAAIQHYCNDNKVPQLFVSTGASMFSDPEHFPWTIGFNPSYRTEARIYAKHILSTKPDAKIAFSTKTTISARTWIGLEGRSGPSRAGMVIKEVSCTRYRSLQ